MDYDEMKTLLEQEIYYKKMKINEWSHRSQMVDLYKLELAILNDILKLVKDKELEE